MADGQRERAERAIRAGYFDKNAFRRKERLILVLKTGVAGLAHYIDKDSDNGKALLARLVPGTELMLFRDMDNEHDKWAVSVFTKDDEELGYITRFKNETIARLMDSGKRFVAVVDEPPKGADDGAEAKQPPTPTEDFEVPFSVYMEDI